jgi:hypothetical protein
VQEERGPRKTTRLKKLFTSYAEMQNEKVIKLPKENSSKFERPIKFTNTPKYNTWGMNNDFLNNYQATFLGIVTNYMVTL